MERAFQRSLGVDSPIRRSRVHRRPSALWSLVGSDGYSNAADCAVSGGRRLQTPPGLLHAPVPTKHGPVCLVTSTAFHGTSSACRLDGRTVEGFTRGQDKDTTGQETGQGRAEENSKGCRARLGPMPDGRLTVAQQTSRSASTPLGQVEPEYY
ncbi:hypothetical protein CSOJ01_09081 [Colletotrichum sojae]|uniref:Uncharacterized protein n=1 Tax=Colletotrichum sojae TaxID=2175907 RepID=A0A8H6MR52_9PEZI|nr:hypothetical protein CSOJ01_09081 [Colletotrichum sojae]